MHHVSFEDVAWHVPTNTRDGLDLAEEPSADQPGRKFLVDGDAGFYVQTVRIPPHFEAPSHHHDHPEVFMVIGGSCMFENRPMRPLDVTIVEAGEPYSFTAGPDGVQFVVTRHAVATFVEEEP